MWVTVLILGREFLVTGLRQIAVEAGQVMAADRLGKWKTTFQLTYLHHLPDLAHRRKSAEIVSVGRTFETPRASFMGRRLGAAGLPVGGRRAHRDFRLELRLERARLVKNKI